MSGLIISVATDQSRRTRAQGGVHVTDRKTTPCEGRNDRRPRRPVEALARTCAAGRPGVHKHGSPPRRPQFYRNYGQRAASGADHAVHGLGRDQIEEARARRLAHHRVPGLGAPITRGKPEEGCTPWSLMNVTQMFRCPIGRRFANGIRQHPHQALHIAARSKRWWIEAEFACRVGTCH
jgi:hypothetical protein